MKKVLVLLASILIFCSHGLFLKTNAYYLGTYEESEIFPFSFTHNKRDNTLNKDRIIHAEIVGNDYDFIPEEKDWYDHDDATYLKFETGASGTYVAGISTSESRRGSGRGHTCCRRRSRDSECGMKCKAIQEEQERTETPLQVGWSPDLQGAAR